MTRGQFARHLLIGGGAMIWIPAKAHHAPVHRHVPHILPFRPTSHLKVSLIEASVRIRNQVATTTLSLTFDNPHRSGLLEGKAIIPVPVGATLRSFAMDGAAGKLKAELLPRKEARQIYDEIVRRQKDPAILEFAGLGAVETAVFPVPAGGSAKLHLVYEELLTSDGDRLDYVLPRTQSTAPTAPPWKISVNWKDSAGIRTLYSPTHEIALSRKSGKKVTFNLSGKLAPGPLQCSILKRQSPAAAATFLTHRENKDGGYFLMLISPPGRSPNASKLKREVTIVIDRSGSMAGEKIKQARAATKQVIGGLEDGERFNIVTYNEAVESFSASPQILTEKSRSQAHQFLNQLRVSGGTNIHDALTTALAQPSEKGFLPMVIFLTDGLPTIGETSESKIREAISTDNPASRRIFTFGVGVDVNTPLLSRLADDSRATATYVLPGEDVELKVSQVFRRLSGPVLTSPVLVSSERNRLSDIVPSALPDLFEQDQLVILGRYQGDAPFNVTLRGFEGSAQRDFSFPFKPDKKRRSAVVPRLWASRKIAILTEALRDLGADSSLNLLNGQGPRPGDPRVKELVDEIVRLSTEHGILTEYTAFLAREGEVFSSRGVQNSIATDNFVRRALRVRSGGASANQEYNIQKSKLAKTSNWDNRFLNAELKEETVTNVQQIGRRTFFNKNGAWIDSRNASAPEAESISVEIGSVEFFKLVDRLVALDEQATLALGTGTSLLVDGQLYQLK